MLPFQRLLKEQSSVKITLNGGERELTDATIPFTVTFEESVAEKQPTHVLVMDLPYGLYEKNLETSQSAIYVYVHDLGERRLYELSAIDYIQFHAPGKRNLLFVLLSNPTAEQKKQIMQKSSLRNRYANTIDINEISDGTLGGITVGYYEELIEIPEGFFSIRPEKGAMKYWWSWVNSWYATDPTDQCDFRKRALFALTGKPILWLIGFVIRIPMCLAYDIIAIIVALIALPFGKQYRDFMSDFREIHVDFLIFYKTASNTGWEAALVDIFTLFDDDYWLPTKHHKFGKHEFVMPITLAGLVIQATLLIVIVRNVNLVWHTHDFGPGGVYLALCIIAAVLQCAHLEYVMASHPKEKVRDWWSDQNGRLVMIVLCIASIAIPVLSFLVLQAIWHAGAIAHATMQTGRSIFHSGTAVGKFVRDKIMLVIATIIGSVSIFVSIFGPANATAKFHRWYLTTKFHAWMHKTYLDIRVRQANISVARAEESQYAPMVKSSAQEKIQMVAPANKKPLILAFKVGFWELKSKVCKPYAK